MFLEDPKENEREQRRKTPSVNQSRISGCGGNSELSKSMIKNNTTPILDRKAMSPVRNFSRKNTRTIPNDPVTPRNASPGKSKVPYRSETKSTKPLRSTSTKLLSSSEAEPREKSVGKKINTGKSATKKKPKKKVEESDEKKPKKITLKLGKETVTHSASNLEQDIKKAWPSNPSGLLSVYEGKMKEKAQQIVSQPSVYSSSPQ